MADDNRTCLLRSLLNTLLLQEHTGILASLIKIPESIDYHMVHTIGVLNTDIEIAHQEVGEVISRHLEKQTIFIQRIRSIGKEEGKVYISLFRQSCLSNTVTLIEGNIASVPHIGKIETSTPQLATSLNPIYYHTSHLADLALRIFLHNLLHSLQTCVRISVIKSCQTFYKYKAVTIIT